MMEIFFYTRDFFGDCCKGLLNYDWNGTTPIRPLNSNGNVRISRPLHSVWNGSAKEKEIKNWNGSIYKIKKTKQPKTFYSIENGTLKWILNVSSSLEV